MTNLHKDIIQYYVKLTILYYFTLNFLLQSLFNVILNYKIDCKYIIRGEKTWKKRKGILQNGFTGLH